MNCQQEGPQVECRSNAAFLCGVSMFPQRLLLYCVYFLFIFLHYSFPHNPKTGSIGELEMIIAHIFDCLYMAAMDP